MMKFGDKLKPSWTPNYSYINGFSQFIIGTFVLRIRRNHNRSERVTGSRSNLPLKNHVFFTISALARRILNIRYHNLYHDIII